MGFRTVFRDGKFDGVLRIDEDLDVKTISKIAKMQENDIREKY